MMSSRKKRLLVYALIILSGFGAAFLFLRSKQTSQATSSIIVSPRADSLLTLSLLTEFSDFENSDDPFVSTEKFFSGTKSSKLSSSIEYGISSNKTMKDIPSYENLETISVRFKCLMNTGDPNALYVLAISDPNGKNLLWEGKPIAVENKNDWSDASADFKIAPELVKAENKLTLYPWNRDKKEFFIDDVRIEFKGAEITKAASLAEGSNLFFDFETIEGLSGTDAIKDVTSHSGKKACDLSGGKEYGPAVAKKIREITAAGTLKKVSMSMWVYPLTDEPNIVLTASVANAKNETVFWEGKGTENKSFPKNTWTKINASCFLPVEKMSAEDVLNIGIWNKGKTGIIIDDLEIVYGESPERRGIPSTIDAVSIYEKRFVGEKNKPPFPTIYFEKQEIKNENSPSITSLNKNVAALFSPNDEFLVGDFMADKNKLDEVICLKKMTQAMFSYSPGDQQFKEVWDNKNAADSIWNQNNTYYSVDYNNDSKQEVLVVSKSNSDWGLIGFDGKKWRTLVKGTKKNLENKWLAKSKAPGSPLFKSRDIVLPGNYLSADKTLFLKLNQEWRFDLKLIGQDKNELTILGNVDFKGYPADHNPKYYEFVKIVSGRFIDAGRSSLLIMMANCRDASFNGTSCGELENLSFLPNSTQLYSLPK